MVTRTGRCNERIAFLVPTKMFRVTPYVRVFFLPLPPFARARNCAYRMARETRLGYTRVHTRAIISGRGQQILPRAMRPVLPSLVPRPF